LADNSMRLSIVAACTGTLNNASITTAANFAATEKIAFMAHSPVIVVPVAFRALLLRKAEAFRIPECGESCTRNRGAKDTPLHDAPL